MEKWITMCHLFLQIDDDEEFLFSDEALFLLYGYVNSENIGSVNLHRVVRHPLNSEKYILWVNITKHGTTEPFFFKMILRKERCISLLEQFWRGLEERVDLDDERQRFQLDVASPHANVRMAWFREKIWWVSHQPQAEEEWAPDSPDSNPADFFFWGFFQNNLYLSKPRPIAVLKAAITEGLARHIQLCLQLNGWHLEYVLYVSCWHCWFMFHAKRLVEFYGISTFVGF